MTLLTTQTRVGTAHGSFLSPQLRVCHVRSLRACGLGVSFLWNRAPVPAQLGPIARAAETRLASSVLLRVGGGTRCSLPLPPWGGQRPEATGQEGAIAPVRLRGCHSCGPR